MPLWHIDDADRFWRASAFLQDRASPEGGRCPFHLDPQRTVNKWSGSHALKLVLEGTADPIMISVSTSAVTYQIIGHKNDPA
jgi:hypothetical protein